jgi:hypothetical protein
MNDEGQMAFWAALGGSSGSGIWSESDGELAVVARTGDPAPGAGPGAVFDSVGEEGTLHRVAFNGTGQTAFAARVTSPDVDTTKRSGIWSEGSGSLELLALEGDPAPGTAPGTVFQRFPFHRPILNEAGKTAFVSYVTGPGVTEGNNAGIWSDRSGSLTLVAREGDELFDTAPGTKVSKINDRSPVLNAAGQIAFQSNISGAAVNSPSRSSILLDDSGILTPIAIEGQAAPGTSPGTVFGRLFESVINEKGQVAFVGEIVETDTDGGWELGVWLADSNSQELVIRTGDPAPGVPDGVVFDNFRGLVLNDFGQVVFWGALTGPNIDESNYTGLWATDRRGKLHLIARNGDQFDVNEDPLIEDIRTINGIGHTIVSGGANALNNAGQITFVAGFTDESWGIYVANLPIPEPSTLGLLAAALMVGVARRWPPTTPTGTACTKWPSGSTWS